MEQVVNFPNVERAQFNITQGTAQALLKFRIPTWCQGFEVKVNGTIVDYTVEGGFCCIDRTWTAGDQIDISLPMTLRLEPLKDKPRMVAIFYGPFVLAGKFDTVSSDRVNITDNYFNGYPGDYYPSTPIPMLTGKTDDLSWIKKTEGKILDFTTDATSDGTTITLVPLYKAVNVRFADYWEMQGELKGTVSYPEKK